MYVKIVKMETDRQLTEIICLFFLYEHPCVFLFFRFAVFPSDKGARGQTAYPLRGSELSFSVAHQFIKLCAFCQFLC